MSLEPQPLSSIWPRPKTGIDVAISFLNTWDLLAHPPELLRDVDSLRRYLAWAGRPTDAALTEHDVEHAIAVRDRLREGFDAASEDDAVARFNDLVLEVGGVPQLVRRDGSWRVRYVSRVGGPIEGLVAESAGALLKAIEDGLWDRLGRCAADPCRCAYVDRTKNHVRRFCSSLCTDRAMQTAYRRRRRAARST